MDTALTPFSLHKTWDDFWTESAAYLSSQTIWILSCVSHGFNSLVWTRLIPASSTGLCFQSETQTSIVSKYLSRTPVLNNLDLPCPSPDLGILELLTKITSLKHLTLDLKGTSGTFLTRLTDLESLNLNNDLSACELDFRPFKKLYKLLLNFPKEETVISTSYATTLTSLFVLPKGHFPIGVLSTLTNLVDFMYLGSGGSPACELWCTKLKTLHIYAGKCPSNIKILTNLVELQLPETRVSQKRLDDVTSFLTNLEVLVLPEITTAPWHTFAHLTRLTDLKFEAIDFTDETFQSLASFPLQRLVLGQSRESFSPVLATLTNLTCLDFRWSGDLSFLDPHSQLTKLRIMNHQAGTLSHVSHLTRLESFSGTTIDPSDGHFFEHLTNLSYLCLSKQIDSSLRAIQGFIGNLKTLDLSFSDVTGDGISVIPTAFTNLEKLDLIFCHVGKEDIAKLFGLKSLITVDLDSIMDEGRSIFPDNWWDDCKQLFTEGHSTSEILSIMENKTEQKQENPS